MANKKDYDKLMKNLNSTIIPEIRKRLGKLDGTTYTYRAKDLNSALNKIKTKPDKYRKLEDLGDLFGFRIHIDNMSRYKVIAGRIKEIFKDLITTTSDYIVNPRPDYAGVVQHNLGQVEVQVRTFLHTVAYELSHDYLYKPVPGAELNDKQKKELTKDIADFATFVSNGANSSFRPVSKTFIRLFFKSLNKHIGSLKKTKRAGVLNGLWKKRNNVKVKGFDKKLKSVFDQHNLSYKETNERLKNLIERLQDGFKEKLSTINTVSIKRKDAPGKKYFFKYSGFAMHSKSLSELVAVCYQSLAQEFQKDYKLRDIKRSVEKVFSKYESKFDSLEKGEEFSINVRKEFLVLIK